MFTYFESTQQIVEFTKTHSMIRTFHGNWRSAVESFQQGDEGLVQAAEAKMSELMDHTYSTVGKEWRPHVFGPVVSVPDYLTSTPTPFRHQKEVESTTTPIRIVASITSSAGISAAYLQTRGIAISALVMKLQAIRPVDLIVYTEQDGSHSGQLPGCGIVAFKVESRPLSLAHAINALANPNIARELFYSINSTVCNRHYGGWPAGFRTPYYEKLKAELFQMDPDTDIAVPAVHMQDSDVLRDPTKWINDNLERLGYSEE
jgi:hypothetical protein